MNSGRLYLKCPDNGQHPDHFKWFDEYHDESEFKSSSVNTAKGHKDSELAGTSKVHGVDNGERCAHCCPRRNHHDFNANFVVCFLGLLFLLVGIIIGRVSA